MAKELTPSQTVTVIMENTRMVNLMVEANTLGLKVNSMLAISNLVRNTEMADGNLKRIKPIATYTKVNIGMTLSMAKVFIPGQVETFIKEIIMRMKGMVMVKCSGLTEACMKENGSKVYSIAWPHYHTATWPR